MRSAEEIARLVTLLRDGLQSGRTQRSIADELGVSKYVISGLVFRNMPHLRRNLTHPSVSLSKGW